MKSNLDAFINILLDKETQKQFLKECEELGIVDEDLKGETDEYNSNNHINSTPTNNSY